MEVGGEGGVVCPPHPAGSRRSPGEGEGAFDAARQPLGADGFPEEPKLEAVDPPAALRGLIPRVVGDVVKFIGLEKVRGAGAVAALEETLGETAVTHTHTRGKTVCGVMWGRPTEKGKGAARPTEVSRRRKAEHCKPTANILWGFQATESALRERGVVVVVDTHNTASPPPAWGVPEALNWEF